MCFEGVGWGWGALITALNTSFSGALSIHDPLFCPTRLARARRSLARPGVHPAPRHTRYTGPRSAHIDQCVDMCYNVHRVAGHDKDIIIFCIKGLSFLNYGNSPTCRMILIDPANGNTRNFKTIFCVCIV